MGNLIWISDYPLKGSSFANVTLELCRRIKDYKVYVLGLGYTGTAISPFPNMDILELTNNKQIEYYINKLKPEKIVIHHSFYFLESLKSIQFPQKNVYGYIPVEGENLPSNIVAMLSTLDQLIVPSEYSQRILRKEGLNAKVVNHGVDTSFFTPGKPKQLKEFRWGYLGLNDIRKQIPRIIEAYSRLPRRTRGNLVISAEGNGHYYLPAVANHFGVAPIWIEKKFMGIPLSRENILEFYQSLSAYVNCATEGFGLPNLEAAACGLPTIALEHGASKEIMGGAALYVKVKDLLDTNIGQIGLADRDDLYKKMKILLEVPPERKRLVKNGSRRVKRYTWEKSVKQFLDAIN